jgi:hypothetical protein
MRFFGLALLMQTLRGRHLLDVILSDHAVIGKLCECITTKKFTFNNFVCIKELQRK